MTFLVTLVVAVSMRRQSLAVAGFKSANQSTSRLCTQNTLKYTLKILTNKSPYGFEPVSSSKGTTGHDVFKQRSSE